jgi:sugar lactone lactonase YvrE
MQLGEGLVWDHADRRLSWVDIPAGRVHVASFAEGGLKPERVFEVGAPVGAAYPCEQGGWVLAAGTGFAHLAADGSVRVLAEPEAHQRELVRMNDAGVDPAGRFWAGSMAYDESSGAGSLYRVDLDGTVTSALGKLTIPNGMGWSPDGRTMYHTDSAARTISTYPFDPVSGTMGPGRPLVALDSTGATPDGLTIDAEGCLWSAIWDGGRVQRYDPGGRLLEEVLVPVARPTSCCFVGPDLDLLLITTARQGLSGAQLARQADAGRLFGCRPGAQGQAGRRYLGPVSALAWERAPS